MLTTLEGKDSEGYMCAFIAKMGLYKEFVKFSKQDIENPRLATVFYLLENDKNLSKNKKKRAEQLALRRELIG